MNLQEDHTEKINAMLAELAKLEDNTNYWIAYNNYKKQFETLYKSFIAKQKQGLSFEDCFLVFAEIDRPVEQAEIDAYNSVRRFLFNTQNSKL